MTKNKKQKVFIEDTTGDLVKNFKSIKVAPASEKSYTGDKITIYLHDEQGQIK